MATKRVYKSEKKSAKTPSKAAKAVAKPVAKPVAKAVAKKGSPTLAPTASKSYKDYITEALIELKAGRKGVSRIALKKHLKENNPTIAKNNNFDHFFNLAIRKGVTDSIFEQPKGPSGTIKLINNKKSSSPTVKSTSSTVKSTSPTVKKPAVKKTVAPATKKVAKPAKSAKTATTSTASAASTPTYKVMVIQGVDSLNQGKGSSRIALKKYVKGQYIKQNGGKEPTNFDYNFNKTVKKAVDDGYLSQPKGPSGLVKILKKGKTFVTVA
ncbi:histone H1 [Monosporozyma servazzii]